MKLQYKAGLKYQVFEDWQYQTKLTGYAARLVNEDGEIEAELTQDGLLKVFAGYAWDGPSGPTIDTSDGMRASLAHDVGYEMMRAGHLPQECREAVDKLFHEILLEDGMNPVRALAWYEGVRLGAAYAAKPKNAASVLEAP